MQTLTRCGVKCLVGFRNPVQSRSPLGVCRLGVTLVKSSQCVGDQYPPATSGRLSTLALHTAFVDCSNGTPRPFAASNWRSRRVTTVAVGAIGAASASTEPEPGKPASARELDAALVGVLCLLISCESAESTQSHRWRSVISWLLRILAGAVLSAALLLAILPGFMSTQRGRNTCVSLANRFVPGKSRSSACCSPGQTPPHLNMV